MKGRSSVEMRLTASLNYPGAEIRIMTHTSTGVDPKTRPGVSFDVIWPDNEPAKALPLGEDGKVRLCFGVVDRDQIRALRNLLTDFLLDFPDCG